MDFEGMRRRRKMFLIRGQREGVVIVRTKNEQGGGRIRGEGLPAERRLGLVIIMLVFVFLGAVGGFAWGIAYLRTSPLNGVFTMALATFLLIVGVDLVKDYLVGRSAKFGQGEDGRK